MLVSEASSYLWKFLVKIQQAANIGQLVIILAA
jgi:hypothetical protein